MVAQPLVRSPVDQTLAQKAVVSLCWPTFFDSLYPPRGIPLQARHELTDTSWRSRACRPTSLPLFSLEVHYLAVIDISLT